MSVWAFYGRVSSQEQAGNNSLPTQQEACHDKAHSFGATHILDFVDAGVPGDLGWMDRPALCQLLDLVERAQIAGIIVYDPDRLARDLGVQLAVTEIILKHNVRLEFCTQEFNASPEGVLFYQLRGAVSQFEKAKIRERTQRGRRRVLASGRPVNKVTTYGLTWDREQGWHLIKDQAAVVRQIFEWRRSGLGPSGIANRLNDAGVLPPKGSRWWTPVVHRMVENPAYMGRFRLHRFDMQGMHRNKFLPRERRVKQTLRPESEWIEVAVPAIVDQQLWQQAQAVIEEAQAHWAGRKSPLWYMASRLLRCGQCGSPMHGSTLRRRGKTTQYYRCGGRFGELRIDCDMPHLRSDELDATVWERLRDWLVHPDHWQRAWSAAAEQDRAPIGRTNEQLLAGITAVREEIARLNELVSRQIVRETDVRAALRGYREQEAALAKRVTAAAPKVDPPMFAPMAAEMADALDAETRQQYLRGLVASITAYPDGRLELHPRLKARVPN